MRARSLAVPVAVAALLAVLCVAPVGAGTLGADPGYTPRVPISAFGIPANWLDPSRLHVTTTMSVGSGFGVGGTNALNVTTLSYSFKAPVWMSVSVGNSFGSNATRYGQSSFFLEGFNLAYRPSANFQFQIQYQNLRSPLQLPMGYRGYDSMGFWR